MEAPSTSTNAANGVAFVEISRTAGDDRPQRDQLYRQGKPSMLSGITPGARHMRPVGCRPSVRKLLEPKVVLPLPGDLEVAAGHAELLEPIPLKDSLRADVMQQRPGLDSMQPKQARRPPPQLQWHARDRCLPR